MGSPSLEQARALLESVPHVQKDRIDPFLRYCERHAMNALWHANRCTAFGASEIGALARHADQHNPLKGANFFSNADEVVAIKQLSRFPFPGNVYTRRGSVLEPALRYAMRRSYDAKVDVEGLKAISAANATDTKLPWLKISPDDLIYIGDKLYIPDYKMPTDTDTDVEDDYGWQLHAYKLGAYEKAGIEVDGILLVRGVLPASVGLDIAQWLTEGQGKGHAEYSTRLARVASLFRSELPGFGLKIDEIEYDPRKGARIKELCEHYWNEYVIRGLQPQCGPSEPLGLSGVDRDTLKRKQDRLALVLAAKSEIDSEEKALKAEVRDLLTKSGVEVSDKSVFPSSLVKPTVVRKTDWESIRHELDRRGIDTAGADVPAGTYRVGALVARLEGYGADLTDPALMDTQLDTKLLTSLVEEHKLDVAPHVDYEPRFGLGRDKDSKAAANVLAKDFRETFNRWQQVTAEAETSPEESGPAMNVV